MRSIERLLLVWVLGALTVGAAALVGASYWLTSDELDEVFDENLKQVALATAYHHSMDRWRAPVEATAAEAASAPSTAASSAARTRPALPHLPPIYDSEGEFDFVTLVWTGSGTLIFTSDSSISIPFSSQTGLHRLKQPDGEWHIYTIAQPDLVVQAAQREASREVLAAEVATKMFVPLAALVVFTAVLMVIALRRGLRPLDLAAANVAERTASTLRPVSLVRMPREIHPLVLAINELLSRLSVAFVTQQRFVADAAHELRTPVTALRLQLQLLERAADEDSRGNAIRDLRAGVARSQHLIEQLLHLSRYEPGSSPTPGADPSSPAQVSVDLGALARDVVGSMSIKAESRGIDLGAEVDGEVTVDGDPEQLLVLLNNLVENALRYTPRGGVVDVRATTLENRPALQVIDSGPGIAMAERQRVFDRFYRGEARARDGEESAGSGLGLAIVQAIAQRHGATVSLHTAPDGHGLEARVLFVKNPFGSEVNGVPAL
ncbi:ATP-binding protein [soil metagenome]